MWTPLLICLAAPGSYSAVSKDPQSQICLQTPISGFVGSVEAKRKMRSYKMGCDCGKRKETPAEKAACQQSAQLEAPDQVCKFEEQTET